MRFKMNNRTWYIKEVSKKFLDEKYPGGEDGEIFGITDYQEQIIYIWEDLHDEQKTQTLIHELTHCYIGCYMSFEDMSWHVDVICNMVANSHFIINDIVTTYTQYKNSQFIVSDEIIIQEEPKSIVKFV